MNTTVVLVTLIIYKIILISIGIIASKKNKTPADFFLGGRGLGPWVASLSASASSSSAWTLLSVSGFAYAKGLSAIWLFPSCVGGFALNWYVLAPRLRRFAAERNALTLTEVLTHSGKEKTGRTLAVIASGIILFSFLFYVAAQFQGAGKTFQATFEMPQSSSILIGSAIIIFYTLIGGFWAVSLTDALQGMVMAATAVLLPIAAFAATGGPGGFFSGLAGIDQAGYHSLIQDMPLATGIGFVLGLMGIGLGYPGQPHVVNRFMAIGNDQDVLKARRIAMSWAIVVYGGMIVLGLCGRILFPGIADHETIFLAATNQLFHPVVAGVMVAAVLSATMSTADSQLLVAASSCTHDLGMIPQKYMLTASRLVVFLVSGGAVLLALFGSQEIFSRVLFAWTAMGAAFGPLLICRLFHGPLARGFALSSMVVGFTLGVAAYSLPFAKGGWLERVFPFAIAYAIAFAGTVLYKKQHAGSTVEAH